MCQEKKGYRFAIDAVLLAGLTQLKKQERVIELGTGCGVIPLILAYGWNTNKKIVGVEIQAELARLARENVAANGMDERITIVEMDFRTLPAEFAARSFDLVLCNPPYRKPGTGRINPDMQKAIARHELRATLADVFSGARHLLPQGGRIALVYPATRLGHLLHSATEHGFSPKRLVLIYSRPGGTGRLVHLECVKDGGEELRIEPPFYIP